MFVRYHRSLAVEAFYGIAQSRSLKYAFKFAKKQVVFVTENANSGVVLGMTEGELKHRLVAILSADVVGYSRLMAEDEVSAVRTLSAWRY